MAWEGVRVRCLLTFRARVVPRTADPPESHSLGGIPHNLLFPLLPLIYLTRLIVLRLRGSALILPLSQLIFEDVYHMIIIWRMLEK